MRFLIALILTALLSYITALFFPWWTIAIIAFIVALIIPQKPLFAFLSAATALFLLWGIQSFIIDSKNDHILASKIADLLTHQKSYILIILITAFIGSIVSGFAALTGSLFKQVVAGKKVEKRM